MKGWWVWGRKRVRTKVIVPTYSANRKLYRAKNKKANVGMRIISWAGHALRGY